MATKINIVINAELDGVREFLNSLEVFLGDTTYASQTVTTVLGETALEDVILD